MGRLNPQPDSSDGIDYADGLTECPHCHEKPPAGDPWTQVSIGTTRWPRACLDCAIRNDDRLKPRRDAS